MCYCDRMHDGSNLEKKMFIVSYSFRKFQSVTAGNRGWKTQFKAVGVRGDYSHHRGLEAKTAGPEVAASNPPRLVMVLFTPR